MASSGIPIIYLSGVKPQTEAWVSARTAVRRAMEEFGCFQAIYTGASEIPIFETVEELFDLPDEIKNKNTSTKPFFGGSVRSPIHSNTHESLAIDNPTSLDTTRGFIDLMWPDSGNDAFCQASLSMSKLMVELLEIILKMVMESHGIVESGFESESMNNHIRYSKYHLPQSDRTSSADLSLNPHKDVSFLTILHQNHVNGLQIQPPNDSQRWVDVDLTTPSSFLIFAGEPLTAWSNDRIPSALHQVIPPKGKEERYSVGLFSYVKKGTKIQPPKEFVDEAHPLGYKPFDKFEYLEIIHRDLSMKKRSPIKDYYGFLQ